MFQKLYPLLFFLFIGLITAQDAPPTDTEDQQNIEASEDEYATSNIQGIAPKDQDVASEEAMPVESDDDSTEEEESKPPKIQKPKTQMGALIRGLAVPGLGHVYNDNQRIGYLWMGI